MNNLIKLEIKMKIKVGDLVTTLFSGKPCKVLELFPIEAIRDGEVEGFFDGLKLSNGHVYREDQIVRHWSAAR